MQLDRPQLQWAGPTITFVIPWYGLEVKGGAELQCRRNAEELCRRGVRAEVFTTTAGGLLTDWSQPAFPPGIELLNGVLVHRFPVRPRNAARFDGLNIRLMADEQLSLLEEAVFVREIVGSDALEAAITATQDERLFIFIPYMFGTTYWGARATARPFLIPCLHDESYAYMQLYRQALEAAHGLIFNSTAEQRLAHAIYDLDHPRLLMLGEGVDMDISGDAARFRERYAITAPFMLYAGRRDVTKNTPQLLDYFQRYRATGGQLQLVCIGGAGDPLPPALLAEGAAVDLGFVPLEDKYDCYAAASLLCQPSRNESFSLVMMEAWSCGTPALVHSDCPVTREFCEISGGGLHFRSYEDFAGCLDWFQEHPLVAQQMGQAGAAFAHQHFRWDTITARLIEFLRPEEASQWR
ncbi:MAG: glycosyltransferase family 4 protein [Herpetosiphonaceae bacterium]|nr:glycosyltransferase family 4 protein [Herpetosiphonaceae bacterium]